MASISMGNYLKQLGACETQITPTGNVTLVAGKMPGAGLVLTKPGLGNSGSVDLAINAGVVPAGNTCVAATPSAATAANLPWFGPNQGARAAFGVFKAPLIYRRENY
jgi:MSHA biogenesis protein MshQ